MSPRSNQGESPIRVQKFLAQLGFGSRREIEGWIRHNRLSLNGERVTLGDRMTSRDRVKLDGRLLRISSESTNQPRRVLLYHKPVGELCTRHDPKGRATVYRSLPKLTYGRWISVGRLDLNTAGLLLFTTDGSLANSLMHPSGGIAREYSVRVLGRVTDQIIYTLTHGVRLDDGLARFEEIVESTERTEAANRWFHVVVMQGRNRLVRRLWESQSLTVSRLNRVRFGPIILPKSLRPGHWMELDLSQVNQLFDAVKETK